MSSPSGQLLEAHHKAEQVAYLPMYLGTRVTLATFEQDIDMVAISAATLHGIDKKRNGPASHGPVWPRVMIHLSPRAKGFCSI
ncbi:hypothetical protein VTL71DRAFT_11514 [Oculimacula yallundae]|uniref:Uncharacterized protein n=1 Tax=Oculimacula yallundae TaxID=86028 RepID=A0ABR4CS23_9HELO